jgi:hypothetical protein
MTLVSNLESKLSSYDKLLEEDEAFRKFHEHRVREEITDKTVKDAKTELLKVCICVICQSALSVSLLFVCVFMLCFLGYYIVLYFAFFFSFSFSLSLSFSLCFWP